MKSPLGKNFFSTKHFSNYFIIFFQLKENLVTAYIISVPWNTLKNKEKVRVEMGQSLAG